MMNRNATESVVGLYFPSVAVGGTAETDMTVTAPRCVGETVAVRRGERQRVGVIEVIATSRDPLTGLARRFSSIVRIIGIGAHQARRPFGQRAAHVESAER